MKITIRILRIINLGLNAKLALKIIILSTFLAIGKRRHKAKWVMLNIDHFQSAIVTEANNQEPSIFSRVYIRLKHRKKNLIVSAEICNWVVEKFRQCVFCALRIKFGVTGWMFGGQLNRDNSEYIWAFAYKRGLPYVPINVKKTNEVRVRCSAFKPLLTEMTLFSRDSKTWRRK